MWSRGLRRLSLWRRRLVCRGVRADSRGAVEMEDGLGCKVKWSSLCGVDVVCWVCQASVGFLFQPAAGVDLPRLGRNLYLNFEEERGRHDPMATICKNRR
jgi:hypothetical protein